MILTQLLQYLNEHLSVEAYAEAPDELTDYVLLEQTASSRSNHIITTTIAVQSYGKSLLEAMALSREVETVMGGFLALGNITRVELETDYNFTNTTTKQYRWQAVYNITHY